MGEWEGEREVAAVVLVSLSLSLAESGCVLVLECLEERRRRKEGRKLKRGMVLLYCSTTNTTTSSSTLVRIQGERRSSSGGDGFNHAARLPCCFGAVSAIGLCRPSSHARMAGRIVDVVVGHVQGIVECLLQRRREYNTDNAVRLLLNLACASCLESAYSPTATPKTAQTHLLPVQQKAILPNRRCPRPRAAGNSSRQSRLPISDRSPPSFHLTLLLQQHRNIETQTGPSWLYHRRASSLFQLHSFSSSSLLQ